MDDAVLVHVGERVGDVAREQQRVTNRDVIPALEPRTKGFAFDERHRVVQRSAHVAGGQHGGDPRMVELLQNLHLEEEPLPEFETLGAGCAAEPVHHHLDGDALARVWPPGGIDPRHPPLGDLAFNGEAVP